MASAALAGEMPQPAIPPAADAAAPVPADPALLPSSVLRAADDPAALLAAGRAASEDSLFAFAAGRFALVRESPHATAAQKAEAALGA
ncbi:MAG: hypothetical protein IJS32_02595, partial [Kiritimatiellae bacterium]|nr:hypothetical protein [Kiritimatiellia bacterium]